MNLSLPFSNFESHYVNIKVFSQFAKNGFELI